MALIIDPDSLNQGTEVTISTAARTFTLNIAGNLSADGVTGQAFYSWLKEEWKSDANLIPYPFPMIGITPEQFEFIDGWKLANDASRKLIRTAGWKEIDVTGTTNREYCGITTLGDIDATSKTVGDKAYYSFSSSPSQNFFTYAGPVDEAVQFYGDASNGNFDYTNDTLNLYIRIEGKLYGSCFSTESTIQAKVIKLSGPLAEANDAKITHTDAQIAGDAPYTGMGIEFFSSAQTKTGFSTGSHDFGIVVDGNTGSVEQIYEFLQWSLRQNSDIDDGTGTHLGTLTDAFAQFVGDRLDTLAVTNSEGGGTGVFLDDVATDDTNSMRMIDNTGTYREYPFVATGNIIFNTNLQNDADAIYRMFFLYTHATAVSDLAVSSSSGANASLDSAGGNLPSLSQNDYIYVPVLQTTKITGFGRLRMPLLRQHKRTQPRSMPLTRLTKPRPRARSAKIRLARHRPYWSMIIARPIFRATFPVPRQLVTISIMMATRKAAARPARMQPLLWSRSAMARRNMLLPPGPLPDKRATMFHSSRPLNVITPTHDFRGLVNGDYLYIRSNPDNRGKR
jgi:hypothetical protein